MIVHLVLAVAALIVVARLIELQVIKGKDFLDLAQAQHFAAWKLPAKRGEVLSRNARTNETSILATNATLDLVYVDPVITDNPTMIAELLSDTLVTEEVHAACSAAEPACPGNCLPSTARHLIHWNASADSIPERSSSRSRTNSRFPLPRKFPNSPKSVVGLRARLKTAFAKSASRSCHFSTARPRCRCNTWRRWRFLGDDRRRCQPHLRQPGGGTPTADSGVCAQAHRLPGAG